MITLEWIERKQVRAALCAEATIPGEDLRKLLAIAKWVLENRKAILDGLEAGDRFYYGAKEFYKARDSMPEEAK